jgi:hypothetical protein
MPIWSELLSYEAGIIIRLKKAKHIKIRVSQITDEYINVCERPQSRVSVLFCGIELLGKAYVCTYCIAQLRLIYL